MSERYPIKQPLFVVTLISFFVTQVNGNKTKPSCHSAP